jgi:hypothetical protein
MPTNTNPYTGRSTVVAYFDTPMSAETAMAKLRRARFRADQIGCSCDDSYAATGTVDDHRSFWDKVSDYFAGEDRSDGASQQRYELRVPEILRPT